MVGGCRGGRPCLPLIEGMGARAAHRGRL